MASFIGQDYRFMPVESVYLPTKQEQAQHNAIYDERYIANLENAVADSSVSDSQYNAVAQSIVSDYNNTDAILSQLQSKAIAPNSQNVGTTKNNTTAKVAVISAVGVLAIAAIAVAANRS